MGDPSNLSDLCWKSCRNAAGKNHTFASGNEVDGLKKRLGGFFPMYKIETAD